ncbi:MAG: hypothetical protein IJI45_02680 [Anaerolineaceae bacterium]|nr:hypothetical protein [Anaerolineaceae bacterium]
MDYSKLTDEELFAEIEKTYGKEWTPKDLNPESELFKEYVKRISTGCIKY